MSRMSQLYAELTEQAAQLGFHSIEEAEINGFKVDYEKQELVPDEEQAYKDLEKTEKQDKEAKRIEIVWRLLSDVKETIALLYKPDGQTYSNPADDITDEKIQDYFYKINKMCCELSDRNIMLWQKEENENQN